MRKITNKLYEKKHRYQKRKEKSNNRLKTNTNLPRVIVNKSNCYNYAQVVDKSGKVLAVANDLKDSEWTKKEKALRVWQKIAEKLKSNWIEKVAFDRNWNIYHGRVAKVAEWIRQWWVSL